jgi:hypothetical protein
LLFGAYLDHGPIVISLIKSQKKDKILKIPFAMPMMMKIPMKEPVIRRTVPSTLPFLRRKLTMLAERIPKPRMGRAESRINPTFPRDITFFKMGLSFKWVKTLSVFLFNHRMGKKLLLECSKMMPYTGI